MNLNVERYAEWYAFGFLLLVVAGLFWLSFRADLHDEEDEAEPGPTEDTTKTWRQP